MKAQCIVLVNILIAVLSSAVCNGARPRDDKTIVREIQAKLYHNALLKTRDISIIAENGVVTLSGQVSSEAEKASAEQLAATELGVKRVINELAIVRPSPASTRTARQTEIPKEPK